MIRNQHWKKSTLFWVSPPLSKSIRREICINVGSESRISMIFFLICFLAKPSFLRILVHSSFRWRRCELPNDRLITLIGITMPQVFMSMWSMERHFFLLRINSIRGQGGRALLDRSKRVSFLNIQILNSAWIVQKWKVLEDHILVMCLMMGLRAQADFDIV